MSCEESLFSFIHKVTDHSWMVKVHFLAEVTGTFLFTTTLYRIGLVPFKLPIQMILGWFKGSWIMKLTTRLCLIIKLVLLPGESITNCE